MSGLCRGCERFKQSEFGSCYEFTSDPGWSIAKLIFDIDKLKEMLITAPRLWRWESKDTPSLQHMVATHEIFPEHLDHVDTSIPLLLGEFTFIHDESGKEELFHLCCDGHHRLAKELSLGHDIKFYVMTELEMREAAFTSMRAYMESKGVIVLGVSDEEFEGMMQ